MAIDQSELLEAGIEAAQTPLPWDEWMAKLEAEVVHKQLVTQTGMPDIQECEVFNRIKFGYLEGKQTIVWAGMVVRGIVPKPDLPKLYEVLTDKDHEPFGEDTWLLQRIAARKPMRIWRSRRPR